MAHIVAQGKIPISQPDSLNQSHICPSTCVLPDGRWLVSCRVAPTKIGTKGQHVALLWSDDEGINWSSPITPFSPLEVDGRPGLFRTAYLTALDGREVIASLMWVDHSNPELDFFNEETQGLLDTKIFLARSSDGGETWSIPWIVDTSCYPFPVSTPVTGPVLRLPDGKWVCQFETNKHYYAPEEWEHSSILLFSEDEGSTWPEYAVSSHDPKNRIFYWDQRPATAPNGTLLNLYWTYDNEAAHYLNIHMSTSVDGGQNWTIPTDIEVPGQPAQPVFLNDGRIVMAYVDRSSEPVLKARISADDGVTWPTTGEIELYRLEQDSQTVSKHSMQDAWAEMANFSLGLPTSALLESCDILTVFYAGPNQNCTDIRWVRYTF